MACGTSPLVLWSPHTTDCCSPMLVAVLCCSKWAFTALCGALTMTSSNMEITAMMKIMVWLETQSGIHVCIFSNSMNMVREAEMNCVPVDSGCILYVDENCIVLLPCCHLTMCKSRVIKQRTVWQAQLVAGEGMIERASWTLTVEQTKDWGCRLSSMSLVPVTELGVIYSDTHWYTVIHSVWRNEHQPWSRWNLNQHRTGAVSRKWMLGKKSQCLWHVPHAVGMWQWTE